MSDEDTYVLGYSIIMPGVQSLWAKASKVTCSDFCSVKQSGGSGVIGLRILADANRMQRTIVFTRWLFNENSESWGVLDRCTISGLGSGNYDTPETTDVSDNDKGGLKSWRKEMHHARRLLDEKHRLETIAKSGPPGSAELYHKAHAATSLEELEKIKQSMAPHVRAFLGKKNRQRTIPNRKRHRKLWPENKQPRGEHEQGNSQRAETPSLCMCPGVC